MLILATSDLLLSTIQELEKEISSIKELAESLAESLLSIEDQIINLRRAQEDVERTENERDDLQYGGWE